MIIEKYKNIAQIVRCKENEKIVINIDNDKFFARIILGIMGSSLRIH